MNNRQVFIGLMVVLGAGAIPPGFGQEKSAKEAIIGTWRGTSICTKTPGNESCHDEIVIYEISDSAGRADTVTMRADKVVDGRNVPMGIMDFSFDSRNNRWTSEFRNSRVHILWSFAVHGKTMSGTCVDIPSGVVRRNVAVRKD